MIMEAQGARRPPIPTRRTNGQTETYRTSPRPPPLPQVPPIPSQPTEYEHATLSKSSDPRRRSAPAGRIKKRTGPAMASPEVISTLIDSFSTLSRPGSEHDQASQHHGAYTTPATSAMRDQSSFAGTSGSSRNSLSEYDAYRQLLADELEEPDAAEPPVVRTSKRPSGRSEWAAPKIQHESGLGAYIRNAYARSTSSVTSSHRGGDDDTKSISNVSIESPRRRRSLVTTSRESLDPSWGRRKMSSGLISEEMAPTDRDSAHELVLKATGASDFLTPPTSPRRRAPFDSVIQEEPPSPTTLVIMKNGSATPYSVKEGKMPVDSDLARPNVPLRRSSLRHSDPAHTAKNRLSRDVSVQVLSGTVAEVDEPQSKVMLSTFDGEPTEVTQRIQDLKARKERRDREARHTPDPDPTLQKSSLAAAAGFPGVTSAPRFNPAEKEERFAERKSRIAQLEAVSIQPRKALEPPSRVASKFGSATPESKNISNYIKLSPQPATPLTPTPLPIDYSYVVHTLSRREAAFEDNGASSIKETKRGTLGVGGRSAVARSTAPRSVTLDPSSFPRSSRYAPGQALTTDIATDGDASFQGVTRSNSLKLKRRRWSQPDIPTTLDAHASTKMSDALAVHPPARPDRVQEERPLSAASIDNDIKRFMQHPRLSQKIRHPISGRVIAFSEVGDPAGHVVFCCVGMGLTRYVTSFYDELATTLRLRLITPDRPGVGGSPADSAATPMNWPDDVLAICQALHISKFSMMAHSAGAIYALATALRMPQHIRGRVHLLAPWIPPSQMAPVGLTKQDPPPAAQLPKSQRFLRVMPAPFLRIANTGLLSAASASLSAHTTNTPKRDRRKKRSSQNSTPKRKGEIDDNTSHRSDSKMDSVPRAPTIHARRESLLLMDQQDMPDGSALDYVASTRDLRSEYMKSNLTLDASLQERRLLELEQEIERREIYESKLTLAIWAAATSNANPAVDLLVCLERQRDIGFMYKDITRAVVIHHGSKDTRVPLENVKWLGRSMRRCEVRVLEGEGHGLMASAVVMGSVLEEMAQEWSLWDDAVDKGGNMKRI